MASSASFDTFAKVVNKHVLGDHEEFMKLKQRFEAMEHAKTKAGAAALGYLVAKGELKEAAIDDQDNHNATKLHQALHVLISGYDDYEMDVDATVDKVMTEVYWWLDGELAKAGYLPADAAEENVRYTVEDIFSTLVIPGYRASLMSADK